VVALVAAGGLAVFCTSAGRDRVPGALVPAASVTAAVAAAIALWGIHANEATALARIEGMLDNRPRWSETARAFAFDQLGIRAINASRFDQAARLLEKAIVAAPNPRYFHEAGLAYLGAGRLEDARVKFAHTITLTPNVPDPWVGLARVALARGDRESARAYADSALARDPTNADGLALRRAASP
jgi:Flp pilus assembly protein TadD